MGKTTLLETMVRQKRCKTGGTAPTLQVLDDKGEEKTIESGSETRLLGGNFSQDLTWRKHFETGEKALLPDLRSKIGALKYVSKNIPLKVRKLLVEGIVLSKIICLIPMWGGLPQKIHEEDTSTYKQICQTCLKNKQTYQHQKTDD